MPHVLIVEDDVDSAEMLAKLVGAEGFSTSLAFSLAEARQQIAFREPDLILLDIVLPDGTGIDLFKEVPDVGNSEIVLITGHASLETSIQALRLGATDYLVKPLNVRHLKGILSRLTSPVEMKSRLTRIEDEGRKEGRFGRLRGCSPQMREVYRQISRVAATSVSVLISGESGTGKEMVAQTIHELSRRSALPFLAVNCGAISPQLIESEIFGHEKGSFTGATRQHRGHFERAHGGTLLLDEITEMPLDLQVKLLRVLESGTLMRIGGDETIETDVRILAATNRSPQEAVAAGKLREDLYYRLNVFQIDLAPLRERVEDIELLAQHFLAEINAREGTKYGFTPEALAELRGYYWPGNVRQLYNAVQRAVIMAEDSRIDVQCLSFDTAAQPSDINGTGAVVSARVGTTVADIERRLIMATLEHCGGRREKAAALLGVSPKTLYNRLREYQGEDAADGSSD
jgi:DNA-binding NtrC family response regulator